MDRHQFSGARRGNPRPNRLERRAIGQCLVEFHNWIRCRIRPFADQLRVVNSSYHLSSHDSTFAQPLVGVSTKYISLVANGLTDVIG